MPTLKRHVRNSLLLIIFSFAVFGCNNKKATKNNGGTIESAKTITNKPSSNISYILDSTRLGDWKIIKTTLSSCMKSYVDTDSLEGQLLSKGIINNDTITVCNEYQIVGSPPSTCQDSSQDIPKNSLVINNNKPFMLGDTLLDIDIDLYLPQTVFEVEKDTMKFIVVEFYNVSLTTVGGYYNYVAATFNKNNQVENYFEFPYKKEPISDKDLITNIKKNFSSQRRFHTNDLF